LGFWNDRGSRGVDAAAHGGRAAWSFNEINRIQAGEGRPELEIGISTTEQRRDRVGVEKAVGNAAAGGVHVEQATFEAGRETGADANAEGDKSVASRVNEVPLERKKQRPVGGFNDVAGRATGVRGAKVIIHAEPKLEIDKTARELDFGRTNRRDGVAAELEGEFAIGAQRSDGSGVDRVHLTLAGEGLADDTD
jgi:hypothetical protein